MINVARNDYDWIDDAFNDSKADPLAEKGMTGCSSLAVVICVIAVIVIIGFLVSTTVGLSALLGEGV